VTISLNPSKSALLDGDRAWCLAVHLAVSNCGDDAVDRLVAEADGRRDALALARNLGEAELRRRPPNVRAVLRALDLLEDAARQVTLDGA
jgi:hypothetical protein